MSQVGALKKSKLTLGCQFPPVQPDQQGPECRHADEGTRCRRLCNLRKVQKSSQDLNFQGINQKVLRLSVEPKRDAFTRSWYQRNDEKWQH